MKICMMSLMLGDKPIEEIVSIAQACKMEAIDWIGLHNHTAAELKKVCDDAGLPIVSHTMFKWGFVNDDPAYFDEFKASLDDACTLNAPIMMLPPFPRKNQTSLADDRSRYLDYFGRAVELAKKANVTLTLESTGYGNSPITTADECLELLNALPDLMVTFDQGNVATAEDPIAAFAKLRDRVVHFHVKDWTVSNVNFSETSELKRCGRFFDSATIGYGDMDIAGFWKTTNERERQLFVNPETKDWSNTRPALEVFQEVCRTMKSWEEE